MFLHDDHVRYKRMDEYHTAAQIEHDCCFICPLLQINLLKTHQTFLILINMFQQQKKHIPFVRINSPLLMNFWPLLLKNNLLKVKTLK